MENVQDDHRRDPSRSAVTSDEQIQKYLRKVQSSLTVPRRDRRRILEEIESHLQDGSAEYMLSGTERREAVAQVMEELGPPEAVAASFANEGPAVPNRTGLMRWLPIVLPLTLCALMGAYLVWTITWIPGGWTDGERLTQLMWLRRGVTCALLSIAAYLCIRRADRDPWWWWAAWAPAGVALATTVIW